MIACLVKSVVETREEVKNGGSVLVFLPGLEVRVGIGMGKK